MDLEIVFIAFKLTAVLQAFQNLMNLHILFAPVEASSMDIPVPPMAIMPLTLDEETQYRCAGFIQAEIERYAEEIEELSPPPSEGSDEEGDKSGDEAPAANKRKKVKKTAQNGVTCEYEQPETATNIDCRIQHQKLARLWSGSTSSWESSPPSCVRSVQAPYTSSTLLPCLPISAGSGPRSTSVRR